jgi:hypothetical protein
MHRKRRIYCGGLVRRELPAGRARILLDVFDMRGFRNGE